MAFTLQGAARAEDAMGAASNQVLRATARLNFAIRIPAVLQLGGKVSDEVQSLLPPSLDSGTARLSRSSLSNLRGLMVSLHTAHYPTLGQALKVYTYSQP